MTATTAQAIPPLPISTAGAWHPIVCEDMDMIRRWLNVMRQMDRQYLLESPLQFRNSIFQRPSKYGAAYYFWNRDGEVVVRLAYAFYRNQHQVVSSGFVGSMSPESAMDLIADRTAAYLRERQSSAAFAIVPKQMDNPLALQLYDCALRHPRMRVTIESDSPNASRWQVEFPELLSP